LTVGEEALTPNDIAPARVTKALLSLWNLWINRLSSLEEHDESGSTVLGCRFRNGLRSPAILLLLDFTLRPAAPSAAFPESQGLNTNRQEEIP
jgi:hypothetical protein